MSTKTEEPCHHLGSLVIETRIFPGHSPKSLKKGICCSKANCYLKLPLQKVGVTKKFLGTPCMIVR